MEVLFVSHKYPPSVGGMEKQSYELISGMAQHAKVYKIVYTGEESYFQFFRKLNNRILQMIHTHPAISIIHFNDGLIATLSMLHSGYSHVKRVVTVHGLDVVFPLWIYQRVIIPKFNRFDHIIAVSNATAQALKDRKVHQDKISVINNGIDHSLYVEHSEDQWVLVKNKYNIPNEKKILLMLGRPVKRKGFSWFISEVLPMLSDNILVVLVGPFQTETTKTERMLRFLPSSLRNLYMLFMGYPSDQQALRFLLESPDVKSRAKHLGKLPQEDLKVLLSYSDIFLMPNIRVEGDMEGFGLVCLEASLSGSLVLASPIEGITDAIIADKNGRLVSSASPSAWKHEIEEILDDDSTLSHNQRRFRDYTLKNYSWLKMTTQYARLFKAIDTK